MSVYARITILEAVIMLLMSAASAYSLWTENFAKLYVVIIAFFVLVSVAGVTLAIRKLNPFLFSLLSFFAILTVVIGESLIRWRRFNYVIAVTEDGLITRGKLFSDEQEFLNFLVVMLIGVFIVGCGLLLSFLHTQLRNYDQSIGRGIEKIEIEHVVRKNLSFAWKSIGISSLPVIGLTISMRYLQQPVGTSFGNFDWSFFTFGIPAFLLLGGFIYWMYRR